MRLFVLLFALSLAGCVTPPARPPVDDPAAAWAARQTRLARVDAWELRGRLAVTTAEEGANASFHWLRRQARHRLSLAGPFGSGGVRIEYDGDIATLRDSSGEVYYGHSVQELLARATGWRLPIEGLDYWVLGLPAPGAPARRELDAWGRLAVLEQLGWRIEFVEYFGPGLYELPRRIFIARAAEGARDFLEARFVIERWTVGDGAPPTAQAY